MKVRYLKPAVLGEDLDEGLAPAQASHDAKPPRRSARSAPHPLPAAASRARRPSAVPAGK